MQFVLRLLRGCHVCLAGMENSQWRAYDVLGTRLCASFHLTRILLTFVSISFSLSNIHIVSLCIRHCVTDLHISPLLILIATVCFGMKTIPVSQMKKPGVIEVKWFAQGHTDRKWWRWHTNPGCLAPDAVIPSPTFSLQCWYHSLIFKDGGAEAWLVCRFIHVFCLHTLCIFYLPQLPPLL